MDELEAIATARALAGQPCVAVKFATATTGKIVDVDDSGAVVDSFSLELGDSDEFEPPVA